MNNEPRPRRMRDRIPLPLQIQIDCRESATHSWGQSGRLLDVSQHGAGFILKRPTEPGRLMKLAMPLPSQLRNFDHGEPQYVVWGVVRHSSPVANGSRNAFRVGVAFVGKMPPPSFETDPATRFEPSPPAADEAPTWRITDERPSEGQSEDRRRETRHVIPIEVMIETFDENGETDAREYTVTENISHRGTSVPTNLPLEVGRFVRISSERDKVSMFAAVRCRFTGADGVTRMGLEFLNDRWPLE